MEIMYKVPDKKNLERVSITQKSVMNGSDPIYITSKEKKTG